MKTKLFIVTGFIFLTLVNSCKKEEVDTKPEPENKISLELKSHSWKLDETFWLQKSNILYPYMIPSCLLDDKLDYLANDYYIKNPGNTLCSGQQQKNDTLRWKLINNNKQLEIVNKGITTIKDIQYLLNDSLITSEVTPLGDTQVYLYLKYK